MTFTGVAKTITKDIVDPFHLQNGSFVILAALLAAISWNLITWYFGIPSSSSHAIIGSIAGAAIAAAGFSIIKLGRLSKNYRRHYSFHLYLPLCWFYCI